jgi:chromosome segregation protein
MFLKKLELQGFKSFAERAEIEFVPGITAIVGPNGAGKSNLVDAILWALGESNVRNLRGATGSDIIFAGAEGRRRLGMASVSLTLDNESGRLPVDFGEVTVTRRIYRSGDGEFLINRSACRLRDIYELFLDTGVGREAYSIVTQGHIDAIISSRPEERREFFEEAAGVKKYRWKKRETIRRLDQVERNLERVRDILAEIEPRLDPLEKQAADARRYEEIHDEFRRGQLVLSLAEWDGFREGASDLERRLAEARAEVERIGQEIADAEREIAEAKAALARSGAEEEELRDESAEAARRLDRAEAELAMRRHDLDRARQEAESTAADVARLDAEVADAESEIERLQAQLADAAAARRSFDAELGGAEAVAGPVEQSVPGSADALEPLRGRLEEMRRRMRDIAEQCGGLSEVIARAESDQARLAGEVSRLEGELSQAEAVVQSARAAAVEAARRLEASSSERGSVAGRSQALTEHLTQVQAELAGKESRLRALVEIEESREGYAAGPRAVLRAANDGRLDGQYQTVADVIQVPQDYERSIEIALGPALQYVVTANEDDARRAIEYLKREQAGRATFLPLTLVRAPSDANTIDRLLRSPGVIGRAADLVVCDPAHRTIVSFLLRKTLVIDNLDTGFRLRSEWGWSKLVTLDGELFYPSGAVAGGWFRRDARPGGGSPLARQREIGELQTEVGRLRGRLNEYERDLISTRTLLVRVGDDQEELGRQGVSARLGEERAAMRCEEIRGALAGYRERLEACAGEKLRAAEELHRLSAEEERLRSEADELERKLLDRGRIAYTVRAGGDDSAANADAAAARFVEVQVALARAAERERALEGTLERAQTDADRARRRLEDGLAARDRSAAAIADLDRIAQEQADRVDAARRAAEERSARVRERREARAESAARLAELERELSALYRRRESAREHHYEAERSMAEIRVRREQMAQRLAEEFGIDLGASARTDDGWYLAPLPDDERLDIDFALPDAPLPIPTDEQELRELRRRVRSMSGEIRRMGSVNLAAIEEFDTLRERCEFLTREHNDLVESRASLVEAMHELDAQTREAFMDVFHRVGASFQRMFTRIFGGGRCELVLTDPSDLLNTGIEVVVQPPGKKLTNLVLLSGGERALTAMALVFALLDVKPSPFCVIDELDAPLDDANVDRYVELLREFARCSQFVIVTHNRRTMAAADALYGVTMESPGVSKLISVRLAN